MIPTVITSFATFAVILVICLPAGARPLTPNDPAISENLLLWLRDPATHFDPATGVWSDLSGHDNDAQPVGKIGEIGGIDFAAGKLSIGSNVEIFNQPFSALKFDANTAELMQSVAINGGEGLAELTIVAVYKRTVLSDTDASVIRPLGFGSWIAGDRVGNYNFGTEPSTRKDNGSIGANRYTIEHLDDAFFVRASRMSADDGINEWFNVNGSFASALTDAGTSYVTGTDNFYIGDLRVSVEDDRRADLEIAELAVYNAPLEKPEVEGVMKWMQINVGLPIVESEPLPFVRLTEKSRSKLVWKFADRGDISIETDTISVELADEDVTADLVVTKKGADTVVTYHPNPLLRVGGEFPYTIEAEDTNGNTIDKLGRVELKPALLPYETALAGPGVVDGVWNVRYVFDAWEMDGLEAAVAAVQAADEPGFRGQIVDVEQPFMDMGDGGIISTGGMQIPDAVLESERWGGNDFVAYGHGFMVVEEAGTYTIGVASDDGFAFRIFGAQFSSAHGSGLVDDLSPDTLAQPGTTVNSDTLGVVTLAAGSYEIEFLWYDHAGGEHCEIYAARGEFATYEATDTWALIGDPENGGFSLSNLVPPVSDADARTMNGLGNNIDHPEWGAAGARLERFAPPFYGDGVSTMADAGRPNPRVVSNTLSEQAAIMPSSHGLSDMVWVWGQFLDHDISLTSEARTEFAPVVTAVDDLLAPMIPMMRSTYDPSTGTDLANPRQQMNAITAFIDGSNVYGSDGALARRLRTGRGGELRITETGMLPKNLTGVTMANPVGLRPEALHSAGDVRANENPALLAMHTLWVREHNFQARELAKLHPNWTDEDIYQQARRIVAGEIQAITYQEFLPALLGEASPDLADANYDPSLNPGIVNEFSSALYRLGHSMISTHLAKVGANGAVSEDSLMVLRDCFFNPGCLETSDDVAAVFRGLIAKPMQEIDALVIDDLRNFLFGEPGAGGLDLIAINIQRGRDHGVPPYNVVRAALGLDKVEEFADIVTDSALVRRLETLYGTTVELDLWVGAVLEEHVGSGSVGETIAAGMREQFVRLRDGDRFFFLFDDALTLKERVAINATRLSDVILRNTAVNDIPADPFHAHPSMIADSDGDGVSDLDESIAGTNPHDANSTFQVLNATLSDGNFLLEWSSVQGRLYTVEYSRSLEANWKPLASIVAANGANRTSFTDSALERVLNPHGYYRVRIRR